MNKLIEGIKYLFTSLIWPILIAYVTSGFIWISYIWYFENNNYDKALISLAMGIFTFLQKDIFVHSSIEKET